ncbi:hypothetical protein C4588_02110 [Candidatus Parcubacteria bacterium]|nr:MAG: hypothetical protein C4588_02110 [Candidatus Parcubacteria bacterium]
MWILKIKVKGQKEKVFTAPTKEELPWDLLVNQVGTYEVNWKPNGKHVSDSLIQSQPGVFTNGRT